MKVYLDNNATTPVDPRVKEAMARSLDTLWGNPASTVHAWGWQAEELVTIAREQVAQLLKVDPKEIIFTSGATEAINLAILGFREAKPKRILYSAIEHKAVLDVIEEIKNYGFETKQINVNDAGLLNLKMLKEELANPTLLVSIIAANNEIGTIQDLAAISKLCQERNALLHLDVTQLLGKEDFSAKEIKADLISCSAHKIYGPKGVGALAITQNAKDEIRPILFGGGHENGLRSGTLNVPGIVGFGEACKIARLELEQIRSHLIKLTDLLLSGLKEQIPNIKLNGCGDTRIPGNLNLCIPGLNVTSLLSKLSSEIALSSTSACLSKSSGGSHVLEAIGLTAEERASSFRIGIGRFNTEAEIEFAIKRIVTLAKKLIK